MNKFERLNQIAKRQQSSMRSLVLAVLCLGAGVTEASLFFSL